MEGWLEILFLYFVDILEKKVMRLFDVVVFGFERK